MQQAATAAFPIGIFDSGIGGLTVASAISRRLPHEQLIYFGDTAHMPYGEKSAEAIRHYSLRICDFLLQLGCKMVVIACNTASASAYDAVREQLGNRALLVNVIEPVATAVHRAGVGKVGVIATARTVKSGVYPAVLQKISPSLQVKTKATHSLASIIEEGLHRDEQVINALIAHYLTDKELDDIEGLILGCTHYPLIKADIERYYLHKDKQYFKETGTRFNKPLYIFDSTDTVAEAVYQLLLKHGVLNLAAGTPDSNDDMSPAAHRFYVSDYTSHFEQTACDFFGKSIRLIHYPIWD